MIQLDLSILNQKGTPMFNSDLFSNRPAAGIVGRIFISTDTKVFYRDTGTTWEELSGSSFSGSLATGQVAFGSATNTISGTNNLFWNSTLNNLGIGSNLVNTGFRLGVQGSIGITGYLQLQGSNGLNTPTGLAYLGTDSTSLEIFSSFSRSIRFQVGNEVMRLFQTTGNLVLQTGGTFVDAGQKLQVNGDVATQGSGSTSATSALNIKNSLTNEIFRIDNAGQVFVQNRVITSTIQSLTGSGTVFVSGGFGSSTGGDGIALAQFTNVTNTSGTHNRVITYGSFLPTSGTGIFNCFQIAGLINQTGGANGITRGLYIQPTLTAAAEWRSIQWDNNTGWGLYGSGTALNYLGGSLGIKTTAPYVPATFSLDVNGGVLIKNTAGTTAQLTLINADPSIGGNEAFIVHTTGGTSGSSFAALQGYYGTSITGSTALRLNPAGGAVIVNSTTNSGEQFQLTGSIRVNGQTSGTAGGSSGQHLIINCDGTSYKIALLNP